jgi:membrane-associated PAP2 superfamily phosphatase
MTMRVSSGRLLATLLALIAVLGWDASGLDMTLAAWSGGPAGFPLREHWLLTGVLHEGGRYAAWLLVLALALMVWWPLGVFRRIGLGKRLQLVVTALAAVLVVSGLKALSRTSCPWDLASFGRSALHVSHWALLTHDGGSGRCFPAGHATSGFAFVGGYFAFAAAAPRVAWVWLAAALCAGLLLGVAQQLRGAHFMSHTLWSAWLCWCVALLIDGVRFDTWRLGRAEPEEG